MNNSIYLKALCLSVVIAAFGVAGSYVLSSKIKGQLQKQEHAKLESISRQISVRFQDSLDTAFRDLRALQAFYSVGLKNETERAFSVYTDTLDVENIDHIQALSWVPLIREEQRLAFEKRVQKSFPDFLITERDETGKLITSHQKDYYLPVTYLAPYFPNKVAHGFDINSNDIRRASLEQARDTGSMVVTAKVRLVQEQGSSYGFLIIAPVYKTNVLLGTLAQRRNELEGYVTGVFRINSLMQSALNQANESGLTLSLVDLDERNGGLLYGDGKGVFDFSITVPDRQWQLLVGFDGSEQAQTLNNVYWVLYGGISSSLLFAVCMSVLLVTAAKRRHIKKLSNQLKAHNTILENKVSERTEKLEQKNSLLNEHIDQLTEQSKILQRLTQEAEQAKEAAEERELELARSNRDLDDFAYIASHDLKAPLRGIDQLASWVAEDIKSGDMDEVPDNLDLLRQRAQRLEILLNDLLAYSRVNKGPKQLTRVDSRQLISDSFSMVFAPVDFTLTLAGEFPTFDTISPPLEQVIRNLLSNAVKHHDKSKGEITVSCQTLADHYEFSIADDGPGIHEDFHQHIFKMFKTLKPRDEVEGSGMGLALIERIVKHYHGTISVESELGEGSRFTFTWPKTI